MGTPWPSPAPEVLGGAGADVREQHKLDAPAGLPLDGDVKPDQGEGVVAPQRLQRGRGGDVQVSGQLFLL